MFDFILSWFLWFLVGVLKLSLWVLLAGAFGLWWNQGNFLYLPAMDGRHKDFRLTHHNPEGLRSPQDVGVPYEEHHIRTRDGERIHCWLMLRPNPQQCKTLIFFHGNAGNIGYRLPNAQALWNYLHVNVLLVDYRGYGNSSGTPSETGLVLDAEAALDMLLAHSSIDNDNIFVFGRSLGGAVAISLAFQRPEELKGLVVENTFLGIDEMALIMGRRMGIRVGKFAKLIRAFLYVFLTNRWPSLRLVRDIHCPVLLLSGLEDELIPPAHMQLLYDQIASTNKTLHLVPGGGHNDTFVVGGVTYFQQLGAFLHHGHAAQ